MTDYSKITALYSRLSVGDEDRDGGESNSIQNQKIFLENYARGQHLTNIRHYIDDDESGRFFDRSAYSRMMDDVENGKIGVCIMKDLTRWGRDYLQVGNAMEIFRRNNVRFIAVNNGIDSEKPDTLEFAPFINIMSEWYAKDISKKVKTGIKTKGMSGKPIVTEAPYGYVKDPNNKDFWIIDEEAAAVVRLIFRLFIGGKNRNQIAVHLKNEQMFEKAQEILKRRAKPRRLGTDGKREKFSRKYAFSCMLECGFCGGTLTRRSWHSGSQYNKVIWQCVTATKKGKKFCPDSKGIAEETIEQAFIESYRLLCQNNKDVLDEFIARTEETLSDSNASKQLAKVEKDIAALDAKRAKLVDMRLEEIIDKETYEQKYFDLSSQIEQLQKQRESLQESAETESTMKKRIAEFRRTLEENEVLDTFDRYVFESIVEKVIVGGYDEDGNKDPAMLTFIYKTGFKNSLDGTNFKPPRKNSKAAKQNAGLCSHTTDEAKSMCSYHSDDTDRHGGGALHQADEHASKRRVEPRVAH